MARKIGVLTFHRCINYGSYWQARCLVQGLRARGHDAELLDHRSIAVERAELRCAFQPQLPRRTPRSDHPALGAKTRKFVDAIGRLPLSPPFDLDAPERIGTYDAIVVGSDEVWNFQHPWYGSHPVFFGRGVKADRLLSYAASFGNHDAAHGIGEDWAGSLSSFAALSVRDDNSRRLIAGALDVEPDLVLDPCLQFPGVIPAAAAKGQSRYAIVYGHGFPAWFEAAVRRWADRRRLRLVSIGYRNAWADEQRLDASPADFADALAGATAVATNFFHGCVFALRHSTPFVCAATPYRLNKVRDLTASLGAARHLVDASTPDADYDALLGAPLAPAVAERMDVLRGQSDGFLDHALG